MPVFSSILSITYPYYMKDNLTLENFSGDKKNLEEKCLVFVSRCNNLEVGSNDARIAKVIFRNLDTIHDLTIEDISTKVPFRKLPLVDFSENMGLIVFVILNIPLRNSF